HRELRSDPPVGGKVDRRRAIRESRRCRTSILTPPRQRRCRFGVYCETGSLLGRADSPPARGASGIGRVAALPARWVELTGLKRAVPSVLRGLAPRRRV